MSITDELREYVQSWRETPSLMDDLDAGDIDGLLGDLIAIADRIDIAHKQAIGYVDDRDPETMAENGWVRLPKDANGEYIHVGDMMYGTCPSGKYVSGEVLAIGDNKLWLCNVQFYLRPDYMHHYHAPTVEDVLREILFKAHIYDEREMEFLPDLIAEYAAKLRLAGDGE